jgi:hypothetical protein
MRPDHKSLLGWPEGRDLLWLRSGPAAAGLMQGRTIGSPGRDRTAGSASATAATKQRHAASLVSAAKGGSAPLRAPAQRQERLGRAGELVHEARLRHHRPTRLNTVLRSTPPPTWARSVGTSPILWLVCDSCADSTTGCLSASGCASAISSSSVPIAVRSRAIDRSLPSEKYWRASTGHAIPSIQVAREPYIESGNPAGYASRHPKSQHDFPLSHGIASYSIILSARTRKVAWLAPQLCFRACAAASSHWHDQLERH